MTPAERDYLIDAMKNSSHYLEWGMGNSTIYAMRTELLMSLTSVESDPSYYERWLTDNNLSDADFQDQAYLHLFPFAEGCDWGRPKDDTNLYRWPQYQQAPFLEDTCYDLVFVDGRCRVACVLTTLLSLKDTPRILVHDYWGRFQYDVLLKHVRIKNRVDTLVELEPTGSSREAIMNTLFNYMFVLD